MNTIIGLLVVGVAVYFIIRILKKFADWVNWRQYKREQEEAATREAQRVANEREERKRARTENAKKQKLETMRYIQSDLLREILNVLCDGDTAHNFPTEIMIYAQRIQAVRRGRTIVYDFVENRVPFLKSECKILRDGETWNDIYRPMVAIADAINRLMGEQYSVVDYSQKLEQYSDGDFYSVYNPDHVLMQLKSQRSF